jgi:anti-sigma factor ChrR (cupin superfamily)
VEGEADELARTTAILKYAPGMRLNPHVHEHGQEMLVLDGHISDEHGTYGRGTFIKNPPGSVNVLSSDDGCTLFVKRGHLDALDLGRAVVDTVNADWRPGLVDGLSVLPLFEFGTQHTAMVRWAPKTFFSPHRHYGGEEIFVVEGVFEDEHGRYPAGTWIRSPHMSQHQPFSHEGCLILVKVGHLPETDR